MTKQAPHAPFSLLYVEDEQLTRDTVAALIRRRFPELVVHSAENGARGLELFQSLGCDLVVTDLKMPVMHGIEMARRIRGIHPGTPIIVTSAHGDMEYFIDSIEIGVNRYVMKPIDVEKLFLAIKEMVKRLTLEQEVRAQQAAIVELNRELAAHAAELESANRDLESFSFTVSHDLRTPLTNINGYCQVILEIFGAGLDPKCREFVEVIYGETISMSELIKTLLDFSRLSRTEIKRSPTNLSELAQAAASTLILSDRERQVSFQIEPGLSTECDRDLMKVVLDNLLGNAYKYSALKEKARIEFGRRSLDGTDAYFVADNGAGFEMKDAGQIFTPFKRLHVDGAFQGFGIGLATVQRIIQRHGGRVWAEGEPDRGATFYFTLPEPS
ncbi:hypothetical protein GMST_38330 [Geomonas silvestris]|uniref:histidine kinase n=1 Tax=Geomonas silvestris TaxID=2740184 RepID=A0A6V8MNA1_9BACT|nr:response regulator [Geomonas silvestris]GFO61508.1 hypothetical protein GMST_38330 [Geomonas silvestris]